MRDCGYLINKVQLYTLNSANMCFQIGHKLSGSSFPDRNV